MLVVSSTSIVASVCLHSLPTHWISLEIHSTRGLRVQVNAGLGTDLVVGQLAVVVQLLSTENQSLLLQGDATSIGDLALEGRNSFHVVHAEQQVRVGVVMVHHKNGHGGFIVTDTAASNTLTVIAQIVDGHQAVALWCRRHGRYVSLFFVVVESESSLNCGPTS